MTPRWVGSGLFELQPVFNRLHAGYGQGQGFPGRKSEVIAHGEAKQDVVHVVLTQ